MTDFDKKEEWEKDFVGLEKIPYSISLKNIDKYVEAAKECGIRLEYTTSGKYAALWTEIDQDLTEFWEKVGK